jgi:hypothetical protein
MIQRSHSSNQFACDPIFDENESCISDGLSYDCQTEPLTEWNDIYDQLAYVFDCGEVRMKQVIFLSESVITYFTSLLQNMQSLRLFMSNVCWHYLSKIFGISVGE